METKAKDWFSLDKGKHAGKTIAVVPWWDGWEKSILSEITIDGKDYVILETERNRCGGFFFGTDKEWEQRDVWMSVEEVV